MKNEVIYLQAFIEFLLPSFTENLSVDGKKVKLIRDEVFERLLDESNKIFIMAKRKYDEGKIVDSKQAEELKKIVRELSLGVSEFNVERAKILVGDSMLDLNYAQGSTNNMSLRLKNSIEDVGGIKKWSR